MKTDTIFYQIFLDCPEIFFELINQPTEQVTYYQFSPQSVKEPTFNVDGFYLPIEDSSELPFYPGLFHSKECQNVLKSITA